ncbi:response regulator [Streptomyces sp. NPDC048197]|uniref:response regulator n=1 Tax=Streptomyces sp. NPDC048197 TaxID=3365511 RepID=UPI00370F776F
MTSSATASTGEAPHTPVRVLLCDDHAVVRAGLLALLSSAPGIEVIAEAGDGEEAVALAAALHPDVVLMDLQLGSGIDGIEATRRITARAREDAKGGNTVEAPDARQAAATENPAGTAPTAPTPPPARPTKPAPTAPSPTTPATSTGPTLPTSSPTPTRPASATSPPSPTGPTPHVLVLTTYDTDADITRAIDAGATGYLLKAERPEELFAAIRAAAAGRSTLSGPVAHRVLAQMRSPRPTLTDRELDILGQLARGLSNREIARALFISEATVKTHLGRIYDKLSVDTRAGAVSVAKEQRLLP